MTGYLDGIDLRSMLPESSSSAARWVLFAIGLVVAVWGILAVAVSGGIVPLQFNLVQVTTPIGSVATNDRQFGAGLILIFAGFFAIWLSTKV